MRYIEVPDLDEVLNEAPIDHYPYSKAFEEAKDDPYLIMRKFFFSFKRGIWLARVFFGDYLSSLRYFVSPTLPFLGCPDTSPDRTADTSGSTGLPKPVVVRHGFYAAMDRQRLLREREGEAVFFNPMNRTWNSKKRL